MNPVFIQPFTSIRKVECGFCRGAGVKDNGAGPETCQICNGEGKLIDVRTGTVRLYSINEFNESQNGTNKNKS